MRTWFKEGLRQERFMPTMIVAYSLAALIVGGFLFCCFAMNRIVHGRWFLNE